ncbi:MAG: family 78 glycoside hydrolase catalytic domain [Terracidiphilus sp.]|jgi:alpha-L-rhamnosidase
MRFQLMHRWTWALVLSVAAVPVFAQRAATTKGPAELRVDNLKNPLGIDDATPKFSWQLRDAEPGAKQTAYEVMVASSPELLAQGKADVWSSGRVVSEQSLNVSYSGPALKPSTRSFWCVKLWGADGKAYAASERGWWETGLMSQDAWKAQWIGYETPEEATVRHAPAEWIANPDAKSPAIAKDAEQRFEYRTTITLPQTVKFATLYATGQDTVAAWVDGARVLAEDPLPPYRQMPWKKFVRADVTTHLSAGKNTLAIEALHYVVNPNGMATEDAPPMIATLVVEYADGTWASFSSNDRWKTALEAADGWQQKSFDDSAWKAAMVWQPLSGKRSESQGHPWIPDSVKELRDVFSLNSAVKSARLYATALGAYEMSLNGNQVGDQVLAPGWTDYRQRVVYQTFDVTREIQQGRNELIALLAPGWYETPLEWFQQPNNYGVTPPALRAQLRIEHTDGSVEWITTDTSWWARPSEVLQSELYDGETDDRRLRLPESRLIVCIDGCLWPSVQIMTPAPVEIVAQDFPPIRKERFPDGTTWLEAKSMAEPRPGVWVYDFGQNFSGVERLRVRGPAGTRVRMRFAEVLNPDGTIYTDNLRTAKATDTFILDHPDASQNWISMDQTAGTEMFIPQFTFHGFRYMELTGLPAAPTKDDVAGIVIHTDAPWTAKLETGSAMINQLWSNILWGQRSNFVGVPTDCPQRDERLGWMGDAQVFWRTASYNMDLAAFSRKFAADMRGTQAGQPFYGIFSPGTVTPFAGAAAAWSDAGVIVPWTSWLQTGDTSIVEQNWDAMTKYLDAIAAANPDFLWENEYGSPFGDWLSPEGKTDERLLATAYWAWDVTLMREMALATGRTAEADKYAGLLEKIRAAFQKQFVRGDGFVAGADNSPSQFGVINNPNAKSEGGDTQTGYVLALHMNLLPESLRAAAAKRLVDKIEANHNLLATGFLGTPYLLEELTKAGYAKLAYTLLLNTQYPSWGYMVTHGATTMWERWNGDQMMSDPAMNSFNHYAYGAVADWMYRYAAGIDATPMDAGFHTVVLHPVFDERLGHLSFDYDSVFGTIHSDWKMTLHGATWHLTIPANTTGWLSLSPADVFKYKLDGAPLNGNPHARLITRDGQNGFELAPGAYTFDIQLYNIVETSVSDVTHH